MDVGVYSFATDRGLRPDEFAVEVEERGFAELLLAEHTHIPLGTQFPEYYGGGDLPDFYKRTHDPFVALSFAAARTTTLRIGTGVCLLGLRDPIETAKEVASLDMLSGGRFVFGVGYGWNARQFANHGVSFSKRRALVREKVAVMRQLWTQEEASYEGELTSLAPTWMWPKPAQRPHPPVRLGGDGPKAMREAAAWADMWYPTGVGREDLELAGMVREFRDLVEAAGRDPDDVRVGVQAPTMSPARLEALENCGVDVANVPVLSHAGEACLKKLDNFAAMRVAVLGS